MSFLAIPLLDALWLVFCLALLIGPSAHAYWKAK